MNQKLNPALVASVLAIGALLVSCRYADDFLPSRDVSITMDSAVYHLQPTQYGYAVNVMVTVVNNSDRDIYLAQGCGYWGLSRADSSQSSLELGAQHWNCGFSISVHGRYGL